MGPFKWTPSVSIRESFGKTNASAQMLFTSEPAENEPASLRWEEKKAKLQNKFDGGKKEFFSSSDTEKKK